MGKNRCIASKSISVNPEMAGSPLAKIGLGAIRRHVVPRGPKEFSPPLVGVTVSILRGTHVNICSRVAFFLGLRSPRPQIPTKLNIKQRKETTTKMQKNRTQIRKKNTEKHRLRVMKTDLCDGRSGSGSRRSGRRRSWPFGPQSFSTQIKCLLSGYGSNLSHQKTQRTAGFSPWFYLPGIHFGYKEEAISGCAFCEGTSLLRM